MEELNLFNINNDTGELIIQKTITNIIDNSFKNNKDIKYVNIPDNIFRIGNNAFENCENLEYIYLNNVKEIGAHAFHNCKNLKKVIIPNSIQTISESVFEDCEMLEEIILPDSLTKIEDKAFKSCKSLKKIRIPRNIEKIASDAFLYTESLSSIEVDSLNENFITPDNKILIDVLKEKIILYASNIKDKSYKITNGYIKNDVCFGKKTYVPQIGAYSFAGAKNLEELTISSKVSNIDTTTFINCDKLKTLNIEVDMPKNIGIINTYENFPYYFNPSKSDPYPFETLNIYNKYDSEFYITPDCFHLFDNLKKINLPKNGECIIQKRAFKNCNNLISIDIPSSVIEIHKDAFSPETTLNFDNGLSLNNFLKMSDYKNDIRVYEDKLEDNTYYLEDKNKNITLLPKKVIKNVCSHAELVEDDPLLFVNYMNELLNHNLGIKLLFNGILMVKMSKKSMEIMFDNLKVDDDFFLNVLKHSCILDTMDEYTDKLLGSDSFKKVVDFVTLLKKYNITEPILYNKMFMVDCTLDEFENLINIDLNLLIKILKKSNFFEEAAEEAFVAVSFSPIITERIYNRYISHDILSKNKLEKFIKLVKKYNIKDTNLFKLSIINIVDNPLLEELFSVYDANIKRVLKHSLVIDNTVGSSINLSDLLSILKITGGLEKDNKTRQKACTFLTEKIFMEYMDNGKRNIYRIIGDDIHRVFNIHYNDCKYNKEFSTLFIENYKEMIKEEKNLGDFIKNVYLNFDVICNYSTSNRGYQRKLKVTIDKCRSVLLPSNFDNVNDEIGQLAHIIGCHYGSVDTWHNALKVYNESLNAPRNIFSKSYLNENGKRIYDNSPDYDLKEELSDDFSYEWLPKQDYYNLVLGKYCNCCAHLEGVGQGIMRASMILDNCQNLVVRNEIGRIIAKATLAVDKYMGYAVFNTIESSLNYKDEISKKKIYEAFIRGTKKFIETYNANNPDRKIIEITIGNSRNTIFEYFTENHSICKKKDSIEYGTYSIDNDKKYNGDWQNGQKLVLKIGGK